MRESSKSSLERGLILLKAVIRDGGASSLSAIARQEGVPVASAHRLAASLVAAGFLRPSGYARHLPGAELQVLAPLIGEREVLAAAARPALERLAARSGNVVQLGVFEADMVTYLVKAGQSADALFTKVGMQLEAYCSGIGKVLLAALPEAEKSRYLASGPFVALTERTIIDPALLRGELDQVEARGCALDDEEIVPGLQCLAVPVRNGAGEVVAAISTSRAAGGDLARWRERTVPKLQAAAGEIRRACG